MNEQTFTYTLSTECTCENEDGTFPNYCFGCFDDDKGVLLEALDNWLEEHEITSVQVTGSNMLWTRVSGEALIEDVTSEAILKALSLNGSYRLEVSIPMYDMEITAKRYSHDEPTGATFNLEAYNTCPDAQCDGECNYNFCANIRDKEE